MLGHLTRVVHRKSINPSVDELRLCVYYLITRRPFIVLKLEKTNKLITDIPPEWTTLNRWIVLDHILHKLVA